MVAYFWKTALTVLVAAASCGCTTDDLSTVAARSEPVVIRSIAVDGAAPASVSQTIEARLRASVSSAEARPNARPGRITVTFSTYSGRSDAAGYRAEAAVSVQLRAQAGGSILKSATFLEDARARNEAEAERRIVEEIVAKVQRGFELASPQAEQPMAQARASSPSPRRDTEAGARASLSIDTLETLQQAAVGADAAPDATRTATVPLTDTSCKGANGEDCASASPLSGDLGLRK